MVFRKPSNAEPVLAEFIPLKSSCDQDAEADMIRKEKSGGDKKNWLSSTQLWNTNNSNPNTNQTQNQKPNSTDTITKKRAVEEDNVMINESFRRGFIPIIRNELPIPGLSLMSPGIKNPILLAKMSPDTKLAPCSAPNDRSTGVSHGQTSRKQRRSWSTELHRRFVSALQQLGGSQAATPKQIRELMQVEGLTNDEVKSHLQKYRLHTRRLHTDPYIEPGSKHGNCQSNSPDGPFITATTTGGTSTTGGDSMEDGEDARSENCCWKGV